MNWFTGLATFLILWWLSLFIVLPIGVRGQAEDDAVEPGTEPGAPIRPRMWRNVLLATVLAIVFFILINLVLSTGFVTWERLGDWFGLRRPE
jgi:predicted secreted protein